MNRLVQDLREGEIVRNNKRMHWDKEKGTFVEIMDDKKGD